MSTSRSTPRLRLTVLLIAATLGLVATSERSLLDGTAGEIVQLAGLACIIVAALGRIWASVFIAGYKDTALVREGPYSALRHPLYALSTLGMLGVGLATRSVILTVALLAVFAVVYTRSARREDEFLAGRYGDAYTQYRRTVPSFWPSTGSYRVPESIEVRPRVLWKAFLDAGTLIGLYVLLRLADLAQSSGVTPTWLSLP
jgi:protein-S-isoprenylcysteine O-methyltransferase Ste14